MIQASKVLEALRDRRSIWLSDAEWSKIEPLMPRVAAVRTGSMIAV